MESAICRARSLVMLKEVSGVICNGPAASLIEFWLNDDLFAGKCGQLGKVAERNLAARFGASAFDEQGLRY